MAAMTMHDSDHCEIYTHKLDNITPEDAKELRQNAGYLFYHFNSGSKKVEQTIKHLKSFFLKNTKLNMSNDNLPKGFLGISTISTAFGIKSSDVISPNENDARVCFVIGKPHAADGIIAKYFCAMRSVGDSVYLSRLYPGYDKKFTSALNTPLLESTKLEGGNILSSKQGCKRCFNDIEEKIEEQIDKVKTYVETNIDTLCERMVEILGIAPTTNEHLLMVKRSHSYSDSAPSAPSAPTIERINTEAIEKEIAETKDMLGVEKPEEYNEFLTPPPVVKRQCAANSAMPPPPPFLRRQASMHSHGE